MPDDAMMLLASMGWLEIGVLVVLSLPPLFVLASKRVSGGRKLLWFVLTSVFSWLAYLPFVLMTRAAGEAAASADKG
jgi:hypothetical protein